jgi:hypothetical protein
VDATPEAKAARKLPIPQFSKFPLEKPFDINKLDLPDGLKQLLENEKCDLNFLLQVEPAALAQQLGIDEDIAKLIIKGARDADWK